MAMSFSQLNKKLIIILLLIFVALILYIFNIKDSETYPFDFIDNINNNSMNIDVHPGDSIQHAINNVSSGGTVIVYPGLYKENLILDKSLVIIAKQGKFADTVIQAINPEEDIIHITANNVTINGFDITGVGKAGKNYSGSNGNIIGNRLTSNEYGIFLGKSENVTIKNNTAFQNKHGIYLSDSSRNILENNEMNNNSLGIHLKDSYNNQLKIITFQALGYLLDYRMMQGEYILKIPTTIN
jgi:nitrous oxidase accessory protein